MSVPPTTIYQQADTSVLKFCSVLFGVLSVIGVGAQMIANAPPIAVVKKQELSLEEKYLIKNECWFIGTFSGDHGQTRYAYYCMAHPKNPAFADKYYAKRDPLKPESNLEADTVDAIFNGMYQHGVAWGYQTPAARNEKDIQTLAKYQALKADKKAKEEKAADEAALVQTDGTIAMQDDLDFGGKTKPSPPQEEVKQAETSSPSQHYQDNNDESDDFILDSPIVIE